MMYEPKCLGIEKKIGEKINICSIAGSVLPGNIDLRSTKFPMRKIFVKVLDFT